MRAPDMKKDPAGCARPANPPIALHGKNSPKYRDAPGVFSDVSYFFVMRVPNGRGVARACHSEPEIRR